MPMAATRLLAEGGANMNRAMRGITEVSPRFQAGIAYVYYLLIIVSGIVILLAGSRRGFLVDVIATAFYIAVTVLFYAFTKRARRSGQGE
jgi:hypothetical protein